MSPRIPRTALAGIAAAAALAVAPTALATFPGENGAIAFSRGGDIWSIGPDGTGETRLTSGAEHHDSTPEWSPDGRELMFSRVGPEGTRHIYRIGADGSGLTYVRPGYSPQFSREGTRIAFSSSEGISIAARDGSNPKPILEDDSINYTPHDWSPINDLVAWEGHNNTSWIGAISPQRATWTPGFRLDPTEEFDVNRPQWSPDGTRLAMGIAFNVESGCWQSSACIPHRDVGLTVSDLAGVRTVLHPNGHDPAWSPDGTRLAFVVPVLDFRNDPPKVHVIRADGRGARALTVGGEPDWQPLPGAPASRRPGPSR